MYLYLVLLYTCLALQNGGTVALPSTTPMSKHRLPQQYYSKTAELIDLANRFYDDGNKPRNAGEVSLNKPQSNYERGHINGREINMDYYIANHGKIEMLREAVMKLLQKNYDANKNFDRSGKDSIRLHVIKNPEVLEEYRQRLKSAQSTLSLESADEDDFDRKLKGVLLRRNLVNLRLSSGISSEALIVEPEDIKVTGSLHDLVEEEVSPVKQYSEDDEMKNLEILLNSQEAEVESAEKKYEWNKQSEGRMNRKENSWNKNDDRNKQSDKWNKKPDSWNKKLDDRNENNNDWNTKPDTDKKGRSWEKKDHWNNNNDDVTKKTNARDVKNNVREDNWNTKEKNTADNNWNKEDDWNTKDRKDERDIKDNWNDKWDKKDITGKNKDKDWDKPTTDRDNDWNRKENNNNDWNKNEKKSNDWDKNKDTWNKKDHPSDTKRDSWDIKNSDTDASDLRSNKKTTKQNDMKRKNKWNDDSNSKEDNHYQSPKRDKTVALQSYDTETTKQRNFKNVGLKRESYVPKYDDYNNYKPKRNKRVDNYDRKHPSGHSFGRTSIPFAGKQRIYDK